MGEHHTHTHTRTHFARLLLLFHFKAQEAVLTYQSHIKKALAAKLLPAKIGEGGRQAGREGGSAMETGLSVPLARHM